MSGKLFAFKVFIGFIGVTAIYAVVTGDFFLSGPRYKVIAYAEMTGETFAALSEKYIPASASNLTASREVEQAAENSPQPLDAPLPPKKPEVSVSSTKSIPPESEKVFALTRQAPDSVPQPISKISTSNSQTANIGGNSNPGSYFVQLSSVRDQARAKAEWRRLHDDYSDLLNPRTHSIQEVQIPDKGIYYRILVGPFLEQPEALELCQNLKDAGQDCLVLKSHLDSKATL